MRFELFIATRYLRAKRRQAFIGVITGISIAGVAAGVASLVIALAINNGFRQDLQDRLLGSTSHVNLLRVQSDGIRDWRPLLDRLSKEPHVMASAPVIYEQVLISRGPRARGAVVKGLVPAAERPTRWSKLLLPLFRTQARPPAPQTPAHLPPTLKLCRSASPPCRLSF
jgi:lipoprotein-releasing system permease protein